MGACETLGLLKMDFLGPAQPHRPRRLPAPHRGQPRRDGRARGRSTLDDGPTYELLARGDTLGVFQLDGGPMRALLRSMQPDSFEDISAVARALPPRPDGRQRPQRLRRPQERPPAGRADPPRARRAARRDPRRHLRADRLPGAGHGDRAEASPATPSAQADLLRRAMGKKKKEILDKEYVPFSDGMRANGLLRRRDRDAVGHPRPVLRLRASTRRTPPATALVSLLDRLPQGELPGRVHGGAAHQRQGRQGQVGALPRRVPADGHQGAAARRQRVRRPTSPRAAPTSASGSPRSATSAATSSSRSSRRARARAASRDFARLPRQGRARSCATSAPSSR